MIIYPFLDGLGWEDDNKKKKWEYARLHERCEEKKSRDMKKKKSRKKVINITSNAMEKKRKKWSKIEMEKKMIFSKQF